MAFLEAKYEERVGKKFRYWFLDDQLEALYSAEGRFGRVLTAFGLVAVLVACLGLFGLAAAASKARIKEMGIRKALGATVAQILVILTKELVALVCLANLIVWPLAWYATNGWLEQFAYRIELGWSLFIVPAGLALIVALPTVFFHAAKTALASPVVALRHE